MQVSSDGMAEGESNTMKGTIEREKQPTQAEREWLKEEEPTRNVNMISPWNHFMQERPHGNLTSVQHVPRPHLKLPSSPLPFPSHTHTPGTGNLHGPVHRYARQVGGGLKVGGGEEK